MTKFVAIAIAATAALVPTLAAARGAELHRFTRDNATYVYTSTTGQAGQVIDGYNQTNGSRFRLVVRDGLVSGTSNGRPVSFRVGDAHGALVETASR